MALSSLPEYQGYEWQAAPEAPVPGGRTVRERFDALTARQKDEILDTHRYWNVDHLDWWDGVYDCFKADMADIGIEVDRMYFSGFSSQGDGACFEGRVSNWHEFLTSLGYTCPALIGLADSDWRFSVEQRGLCCHENCTSFTSDMVSPDDYSESEMDEFVYAHSPYNTDIQNAAFVAILQGYDFAKLEDEFQEEFKRHMRTLYSQLEAEHDHLTSDEAILDSLECNDQLEDAINSITEEAYA